ncbi:MAG: putative phage tail protein, partial [Sarcina sp.]
MFVKDYVPFFISNLEEFKKLYSSQQFEIDKNNSDASDILNQCFISTCTWGIVKWEELLDIRPDEGDTLQDRKNRCLAKVRGTGTTTIEAIKNIVRSYATSGNIDIVENYNDYSFSINVTTDTGFLKINGLKDAIEEIKPAHLNVHYNFKSLTDQKVYFTNYFY